MGINEKLKYLTYYEIKESYDQANKGGVYSDYSYRNYKYYLPEDWQPYYDGHRLAVRLDVINDIRLVTHTFYITYTNRPIRNIKAANEDIKVKFYDRSNNIGKQVYINGQYAGAVLYDDYFILLNIIYAARELYLYGMNVKGICKLLKMGLKYKGFDNIGFVI